MRAPENEFPIVDTHHHLWDLDNNYYPWLSDRVRQFWIGDYEPIRKNYLIDDYLRDCKNQNVVQSVHLQAQWDWRDPVGETRWLQQCADHHGFPHGIVAFAKLSDPDVASVLRAHCEYPNVKGIRMDLNWHHDPYYRFCDRPDYMSDPQWLAGFSLLERYNLTFDLQIYVAYQWQQAVTLLRRFPGTQFILNNTGLPMDQSPSGMAAWREGMQALAVEPNLAIKISGLGMFNHRWTTEQIRPIVRQAIEIFGVDRCMFASGFPVEGLYGSYEDLMNSYKDIVSDFPASEQRKLFHDNAIRYYRLA